MSIRPQAPAPFLSEEVAERLLALPTPPPSPLSPYSSPLPQIPSSPLPISSPPPNSPTYMLEIGLPLRKRPCRTTPGPGYEVGESSAAGTARQVGPATARADLYGFADMLDAAPGRQTSRELGYGITDTWDDLVGAIQEIAPTTLEGVNQRVIELATTVDQEDEIIYSHLDDARMRPHYLMPLGHSRWMLAIRHVPRAYHIGPRLWLSSLRSLSCRQQTIVKSLKTQMIELQRQQGPAKDPVEPELPEEASSSS
ncbi:hypothetical protein Tco_0451320 [Tanacetum coccineum]